MVFGLPGYPFRIAIWPIPKMSFWLPWKVILGGKSGKSPGSSLFKKAPLKSVEWCPQQNGPGWLIPLVMINFDSPLRMEGWMNLYDAAGCFGPQNSHFWGSNDPWVSVFFWGVCFLCFHPKRGARIEFVSFFMKTFGVFASNRFHRGKIWNCARGWAVMSSHEQWVIFPIRDWGENELIAWGLRAPIRKPSSSSFLMYLEAGVESSDLIYNAARKFGSKYKELEDSRGSLQIFLIFILRSRRQIQGAVPKFTVPNNLQRPGPLDGYFRDFGVFPKIYYLGIS